MSHWDQRAECPDSTCAQVVHSNAETCGDKLIPTAARKDCPEQKEQRGMPQSYFYLCDSLEVFLCIIIFVSVQCSLQYITMFLFRKCCKGQ